MDKNDCDECLPLAAAKKDIEYLWKAVDAVKSNIISLEKKHDDFTREIGNKLDTVLEYINKSKGSNVWVDRVLWLFTTLAISGAVTYFLKNS